MYDVPDGLNSDYKESRLYKCGNYREGNGVRKKVAAYSFLYHTIELVMRVVRWLVWLPQEGYRFNPWIVWSLSTLPV